MATTRRAVLVGGLRAVLLLPLARRAEALAARAGAGAAEGDAGGADDAAERVLVVVQLTGGNDALNMVVPFRQDAYFRLRPSLALAPAGLHRLDGEHGLHPRMEGLARLLEGGALAVVHGVGPPRPDRSHFRSLEVWHTADPDGPPGDVGWLGALCDALASSGAPPVAPGIFVGDGPLPLALRGRRAAAPVVRDEEAFRLADPGGAYARGRDALAARSGGGEELELLRAAARASYAAAERMAELAARPERSAYPASPLARRLRLVARLVAGGFGTRVFQVSLGGFDTHARQRPHHDELLADLSASLAAFQRDLAASGVAERVLTLVFSEFGRRAAENGSRGTDHGAGGPVLLLGPGVRPGAHGTPPDLERLVEGDVPATTDLRAVYAAAARTWMRLPFAEELPPLDVLRA